MNNIDNNDNDTTSISLKKWIDEARKEIPKREYNKLLGEFNYRYVNESDNNFVEEWIINQYSFRSCSEEKIHHRRKNIMNEQFEVQSSTKEPMRRNASIGLSPSVRGDFERRITSTTERINQLVDRMQELQTYNYAIDLEPSEKSILLGIAATFLSNRKIVDARFIKKLPSLVIDSEYYLKDDPGARSLYQKIKGKDYVSLLATIEFYNL